MDSHNSDCVDRTQVQSHTKVGATTATVCPVKSKSLNPQANTRIRELLREILDRDFGGNKTHAAKALKVSASMIGETLKGTRGAGTTLIQALADYTGKTTDDLLGRTEITRETDAYSQVLPSRPVLGNHREFERHYTEFQRRVGDQYPTDIKRDVAEASFGMGVQEHIDWRTIQMVAEIVVRGRRHKAEREAKKGGSK
jgi:plasmid maintenance system antidote protein VapI